MDLLEKYKKILTVAGFVLVVIVLGYLLYSLFFKSAAPAENVANNNSTTTPAGGLPISATGTGAQISGGSNQAGLTGGRQDNNLPPSEIANGGLTKTTDLTNSPGLGATLNGDGSSVQYYSQTDGKFYRVDKNGSAVPLADKVFHQVQNVVWSPNKSKAILEYPDGAKIIYDFSANKQITLPSHWQDFSFSPDGGQVVLKSLGQDPDNRWLAVMNEDGSKVQGIEAIGNNDATVYPDWSPNNQIMAMYTEGIDLQRQNVYFVGLNNENFKSTVIEGRGFEPKWSSRGDRLLYSVYSDQTNLNPNLWIVDAQGDNIGQNRKNLNIATWADKCTFTDNTTLYCAVPQKLEDSSGLFPELTKNTIDDLYQIDTATGLKKRIAVPDGQFNISNIIISDDGRYLYFNDGSENKIHKIKLK